MKLAIISSSNRPGSKSRMLAGHIHRILEKRGVETRFVDLLELKLPGFDPETFHSNAAFREIKSKLDECGGLILCTPIYNWSVSSELKKCIEATGAFDKSGNRGSWYDKIVTFACVGAIHQSYMAWGQTAISLMMDFKCIINPYSIYGLEEQISIDKIWDDALAKRIDRSLSVMLDLVGNLKSRSYQSDWEA